MSLNREYRHLHLNETQKGRILSLYFDSHFTEEEIAEICDCSVSCLILIISSIYVSLEKYKITLRV